MNKLLNKIKKKRFYTTDPISNFLSILKQNSIKKKQYFIYKNTKKIKNILNFLLQIGFIKNYEIFDEHEYFVKIDLKYDNFNCIINDIKRVSKPGRKIYTDTIKLKKFILKNNDNKWTYAISTSKGILTQKDALNANIGGEIFFKIW